jgi:hypothetical protein
MKLTAVILTLNEAQHLPRCLASLTGVVNFTSAKKYRISPNTCQLNFASNSFPLATNSPVLLGAQFGCCYAVPHPDLFTFGAV